MNVSSCSSFTFRSFLVFCGLFVIAYANIINDDDEWIDPFDMLNYDPTTKRMRKPTESASYTNVPAKSRESRTDPSGGIQTVQCPDDCTDKLGILQKEIDEYKKRGSAISQQSTCANAVFKRFLSKLFKGTAKLGLPDDAKTVMHYDAEVKLSKQSVAEIQKLLNDKNSWTTGDMDESLSQILVNFKLHDHEAWKWRFEDTFHIEIDTVMKVSLCVLIITTVICTEVWSGVSWFVQFWRMFAVCFFISLIWNWFHLYMLAFAEHQKNIVQMESFNAKCTGLKQMDWKDSLTEWYRRTWTLQDDPCSKFYEVLVVNPILLVSPMKAVTVTITGFITDPLKHIGQGISEFLRALLKDLPVTLQIPVLLIIAAAIFVFMYGSAQAAIHHAVPWPRLGHRQDPPPPVLWQHQAPQLREDGGAWAGGDAPQPPQVHQEANRISQSGNNANVPQPADRSNQQAQTVQVETLRSAGNISSEDETDLQQQRQEEEPGIEEGGEPETEDVQKKEKEDNPTPMDKREQEGTQTLDTSENVPASNLSSQQIDVKTVGADQGNDVHEALADGASVFREEYDSSFRTPVQETGQ
ncbi:chloride channel CLIC-like protein 1 [Myxocyprinus asiaticus]|uniref:chloride channel CLIC-like protein 1 n=1 Tax=Myxocyprinus asiaticus TaxID=70543 RepID=UPI0022213EA5|nr:chloride channel CLIC-like protein 1 [Myxocyprinus asiaticus]